MSMKFRTFAAMLAVLLLLVVTGCKNETADSTNTTGTPETETTGTAQSVSETATASATTTGVTGGSVTAMSNEDKEFVSKAGMGGMMEVQAGNLALQKAASADVKAFAQRMVTDHSKANEELSQLATTKGLALPTELAGEHKSAMEHLSSLSGAEFDKMYMSHMVDDHKKDVAEFEKASTSAQDGDLKGWAGKTLPTLKEHLQMATDVAQKVK
jgi:putative membrane protein